MPATPVTSSSVASTTTGATRWNGLEMTMSSMANSVEVSFTWQVLLVLGTDVALVPTSSQLQEHFPRQSHRCDQRGCNIRVRAAGNAHAVRADGPVTAAGRLTDAPIGGGVGRLIRLEDDHVMI